MKYSEDRIGHLSLKIHDRLYLDDLTDYRDEDEALKVIRDTMTEYFQREDRVDDLVREKILSQKKNILPGSREWDILYQKYFEEEWRKHS